MPRNQYWHYKQQQPAAVTQQPRY